MTNKKQREEWEVTLDNVWNIHEQMGSPVQKGEIGFIVSKALAQKEKEVLERVRKEIEELKYDDVNGTTREKAIFNDGLYQALEKLNKLTNRTQNKKCSGKGDKTE